MDFTKRARLDGGKRTGKALVNAVTAEVDLGAGNFPVSYFQRINQINFVGSQPWRTNLLRDVWRSADSLSALVRYSDNAEILGAQPARRYRGSSPP